MRTEIYPFNLDTFNDIDLLPASMIDTAIQESESENQFPPSATGVIKLLSPLPDVSKKRIASRSRKAHKCNFNIFPEYKDELVAKSMATRSTELKAKQNIRSVFNQE